MKTVSWFASLVAGVVVGALVLVSSPVHARTWHLEPDGSGDAPTIQAAIDAASEGDVILLACGTYYEHDIVMRSGLILRSEDLSRCATIDARQNGRVLICDGLESNTSIHGLNLVNGYYYRSAREIGDGGGALLCTGSTFTISNCAFRDSFCNGSVVTPGGALYCSNSSLTFYNCLFSGNGSFGEALGSPGGLGGAAYLSGTSSKFYDCMFAGNQSYGDGGAVVGGGEFVRCTFVSNGAYWEDPMGAGGAIAGSGATLIDCTFDGNGAFWGGAIASHLGGTISARGCVLRNNSATHDGGGARVDGASSVFEDCEFNANSAELGRGGGLWAAGATSLSNCTLYGNAAADGGGVYCDGAVSMDDTIIASSTQGEAVAGLSPMVTCCAVDGNEGGDWTGCIEGLEGSNGNLARDPLFCDPLGGDLSVAADSPCLPGNNDCGVQIGAYGIGCGPVPVAEESWTKIKARYR